MEHEHDRATLEDACRQKTRELREQEEMSIRLGDKLTATANALKGAPEPLHHHSTHDVADVAAAIVAERDALQAHRESWRVYWNWRGPEVGGYCSVYSCWAEKEDGGFLYCYTEECRFIEQRPDGKWLAVIEVGEVRGKPWHKDGTRLVLGEFDIWPPVRRLMAARASND